MNINKNSFSIYQDPPKEVVNTLVSLANEGKWNSVLSKVLELVERFPDSPFLHGMTGDAYFQTNDLSKAEDSYKKILKLDPTSANAYFNLGVVAEQKGEFDLALENYKRALNLKDDLSLCHYRIGCYYF